MSSYKIVISITYFFITFSKYIISPKNPLTLHHFTLRLSRENFDKKKPLNNTKSNIGRSPFKRGSNYKHLIITIFISIKQKVILDTANKYARK